jgi:hypothetical protein
LCNNGPSQVKFNVKVISASEDENDEDKILSPAELGTQMCSRIMQVDLWQGEIDP